MPQAFYVSVDDHGLANKLHLLGRRGIITAERVAVRGIVKLGRQRARSLAPVLSGKGRKGISYQVRSRGATTVGRVYNKVFYMNFQSRGTGPRFTRRHAYRGILPSRPFMQRAESEMEVIGGRIMNETVGDAIRVAGL